MHLSHLLVMIGLHARSNLRTWQARKFMRSHAICNLLDFDPGLASYHPSGHLETSWNILKLKLQKQFVLEEGWHTSKSIAMWYWIDYGITYCENLWQGGTSSPQSHLETGLSKSCKLQQPRMHETFMLLTQTFGHLNDRRCINTPLLPSYLR